MGEIAPGVHHVDGLPGGRRSSNVYLLVDEALALIDAGLPGNLNAITRYIGSLGRRLEELRYILITHAHPDHTGGAPALRERTGARILAHQGDVLDGKSGSSVAYLRVFGASPLPLPFLRRVPADGLLQDGDELPLLGGLRVHATPGHTQGSVCFQLKESGVLFCGDMVVEAAGKLRKNRAFPGSELAAYRTSLERLSSLDYGILCPGHGKVVLQEAVGRVRALVSEPGGYGVSWRLLG